MEGCPRSSMLNIDLKDSASSELAGPLKKYINEHYQEDAENYKHECLQLEQLRSTCLHPSHDHSGCSVLRRYFAQLQFLQSRFPMVDGGDVSIPFTWTDLYSEEAITLSDIRFEQASVLHNLGALHSQLGSKEDRTGEEGMKVACTHFQAAAGVFQYLKTTVMVPLSSLKLPWVSEDHFAVPFFDLAGCVLQLYINILLGQAQECLLEKSILDGRKDSLVARISMQVYDYYQQALGILESLGSSYMGSKKSKTWTKAIKIKACHFLCVSYMYMSNHAHENQTFGEKVAYLKSASQKLTEAQKQSKGQPERTLEMLQFMADVISNKLEGAVKDNDFIYHEVVPDLTTLPEIKGASLVKPIPFQPCDPSASGPDIFQRLIPIEAHSDASIYSEEKAKLLRRYNASVDAKNKQLSQSLASLHIDDLLQPVETDTLPLLLREKHETLRKEVALLSQTDQNIQESLKLSEQIGNTMKDISSLLEEDEKKELMVKEICGPRPSPPERDEFKKEIEKCQDALSKANQTNTELVRVYNAHKQNLELIAGPEDRLLSALPSLNIIDSPVDDGAVQRLRDLIAKVEEMKTQRKMLEENLRKQLNEDDITGLLVTREDSNKMAFFDEQLKKHDSACSLIQANVDAQDRILSALTEANAKYAKTRQAVKENSQRREEVVQALILSYNTFCELQGKLSRGVQFYQNLLQTVAKIEEKCKHFFDGHSKELDKLVENIKAASEPPKPPSRPSAAKPDRLVRPQPAVIHSPLPNSMVPGQVPTSFLEHRHPNTMYQHPGMLPGQLPQPPGMQVDGRSIHGPPGYVHPTSSQIPPDSQSNIPQSMHRPGQAVPGQALPGQAVPGQVAPGQVTTGQVAPGHVPGHSIGRPRPDGNLASHPYGPPRSEFLPQPGPQRQVHIPADQLIHSTPRMSYPFPVMQGQVSAQLSRHNVPGQSVPGQSVPGQSVPGQSIPGQSIPGQSIPGQFIPGQSILYPGGPGTQLPSSQYQIRPRQPEPQRPANSNTSLGQTQQIRPAWFTQAPQQPGMVRGQQFTPKEQIQPRFLGQQNIRPQFFPQQQQQQYPGGMRPQADPNSQLGSFSVQNQRPLNLPQQMPFQQQFRPHGMQPISTSSQIRPSLPQPMHALQQGPRNTSPGQLPSSLQPNPMSPTLNSSSSSQQLLRPHSPMQSGQQPMQQPQHQFQQPALPQQQQPFPSSSVNQRLPRPSENMNQSFPQQLPFSPSQQTQPSFRPPFQQPIRPAQPSQQPFRPQQASQQSFRPQQPSQQPFLPQQGSQQPFRPQQPSQQPFRPQQPSQQPFRPQQPPQQPIQPTQPFQQTIRPKQLSQVNQQMQQPFLSGQTSQQPFRPEQLTQPPLPGQVPSDVPPGRQFQQTHFPGQQTQLPFRIESQSHQPLRSEQPAPQTSKPDRQPQNSLQTDNHPVQPFQPPPFVQQTQQPYTDQQPRQASRPDQPPPQQPFQVGQRPRMPFTPRQQPQPPTPEQQPKDLPGPQQPAASTYYQNKQPVRPPKQLNQTDGGTATSGQLASQPFRVEQQPPHQVSQQNQLLAHQNTNKTHSYSETGAFLSGQPDFPPDYPQVRPIPSSMLSQSSRPSRSSVTSSDYLTSYSVALAQTQLSQYQNTASSQHQMQQFQQQLLLQQQQLILQQQEMLRQQQTQHSHESDQSQIGLLMQQIIQQQKQLTDLETKIKDKKEDAHENSKKSTNSSESIEVQEQKPQPNLEQMPQQSKAAEAEGRDEKSVSSDQPALEKNEEAKPKNNLVSTPSSSSVTNSVLPDYETASKSQWFTDSANKQISDTEPTGDSTDGSSKTAEDESDSVHNTSITSEGSVNIKATLDSSGKSDENEKDDTQEELSVKKEETIDKKIQSDEEEESENQDSALKKEGSSQPVNPEEAHKHEIEEQIQQIKELQSNPQQPPTGYLYEPGKLPDNISAATNERRIDRIAPNEHRSISQPEKPDAAKPSLHRQCGHYYESQISSLGQDANNSCLSDDETLQLLVSAVEGFDQVVKSLAATKHGTKADGFTLEWKDLERLQELDSTTMSTHAATMNQSKNRYRDILPWDHTRVKLESKEESDYINANIVKDITPLSPPFIATQGPIATTLTDFWMMVWEQQCSLVVMLTKEVEGNRLMCHQYWPIDEGHTVLFGPLRVSLKTLVTLPSFVKRVMHVQHNDGQTTLVVTHFQFTGWPDYGVPDSPADLLAFMVEVRGCYQQQGPDVDKPILIHCSAGIGRTGTFIVIFAAMEEFDAHKGFVNIPRLVRNLRLQRKYMVQKKEQYEFSYRTVLFYALQFLDLELASIAFKRKSTKENSNLVKQAPEKVVPSAPFCENDDEENSDLDTTHKDKKADVMPTDTRRDSSNIRFLGELKSDDSVDEEDSNDKENEEENLVNNEQLISEKYCKGTLETDEKLVKEHDETDRKNSARKKMKTEKSKDQTQDEASGNLERTDTNSLTALNDAVSIGKHDEVRYTKGETSSNENGNHDEGETNSNESEISSNEHGKHDEGETISNENGNHDEGETISNENGNHDEGETSSNEHDEGKTNSNENEMPHTEESEETVEHVDKADPKDDIESTSQSGTEREIKAKENDNVEEDSSLLDKSCDTQNTVGDNLDST